MTYMETMQAAFIDELEKIAEEQAKAGPKKGLGVGETLLAAGIGGPAGYLGASKARQHGHSALEGGVRGVAGYGLGAVPGSALGGLAGRALGGEGGQLVGSMAGSLAGGYGGYKLLTHPMGVPAGQ